jgi:hypothetical protein
MSLDFIAISARPLFESGHSAGEPPEALAST